MKFYVEYDRKENGEKVPESKDLLSVLIDPDVPSRADPKKSQVKHWLVINIPGNQVDKGHIESEYFGPGPEKGSGWFFLIYRLFQGDLRPPPLYIPRLQAEGKNVGE